MYSTELCHHGIKGQKWGIRRYQNDDGTRTEAGKKRYRYGRVVINGDKSLRGTDFVSVSKKGYGRVAIQKSAFKKFEQMGQDYLDKQIRGNAKLNGVSYDEMVEYINTHPRYAKQVNKSVDDYMEKILTDLFY